MNKYINNKILSLILIVSNILIASGCYASNDSQFTAAKKLYNEGKYSKAIEAFKEVLRSTEDRLIPEQRIIREDYEQLNSIHNYLGKIYKIQGKYDLALKEFNITAEETDSADSCASYFIGEIYYLLEDKHGYPAVYWNRVVQESFDTECLLYAYVMHCIITKATDVEKENEILNNPPWKLKNDIWLQKIIEFLRGQVSEEILVKQATTTAQKVLANYLIGKKYIMDGKTKEAKDYFTKVIETNCRDCIGYDLSRKEMENMKSEGKNGAQNLRK